VSASGSINPGETQQQPVPIEWRTTLRQVVDAFAAGHFSLGPGIANVEPILPATVAQIQDYVRDYGATLAPLREETWESSVCTFSGQHWEVLVDLWTQEEGSSDLVLHALVHPMGSAFTVTVHAVYVP
jgi:hypothetical protein